ncbi:hypothetical protein MTO96_027197 [Rhipicephalus appendiculatus]
MPKTMNEQSPASNRPEDARRSANSGQTASRPRPLVATHRVLRVTSSRCDPTLLFFPVIAAAVTGAAIFLHFKTSTETSSKDPETHSYSRSMDALLQMLWRTGNSSLNPCKDFYRYVCYNYVAVHKESPYFDTIQSPSLVLQGMSSNDAGRALFTYYRSCIFRKWTAVDAVKDALGALLQLLYLSLHMTSLGMLVLIIKLNLAYGIRTDPLVYQNFHGRQPALVGYVIHTDEMYDSLSPDGPQDLFILSDEYNICAYDFDSDVLENIYAAGLTELISTIKVNVTFDQILEFTAKFCSVTCNDLYIKANDTVLGSIVNGVSAMLWKDVVEEYTDTEVSRVILSPVEILKHRFALLTNSSMQPVAMALVVLHAGFVLALDNEKENFGTTDRHVFCELSSHGLYPLWILNHIMSFDLLTEHNNVVMRVFNTLADTIGT